MVNSGGFQKYDYGPPSENIKHYNQVRVIGNPYLYNYSYILSSSLLHQTTT